MNDYYNAEYLGERVAALAKERDNYRRELRELKVLCDKQSRLNLVNAKLTQDLDNMTAERDALLKAIISTISGNEYCVYCKHCNKATGKCKHKRGRWCGGSESFWEWRGVDNE